MKEGNTLVTNQITIYVKSIQRRSEHDLELEMKNCMQRTQLLHEFQVQISNVLLNDERVLIAHCAAVYYWAVNAHAYFGCRPDGTVSARSRFALHLAATAFVLKAFPTLVPNPSEINVTPSLQDMTRAGPIPGGFTPSSIPPSFGQ